ncbi:hypothetical protein [Kribbella sp. DT2]|uniref:hypothetical protein n=1 Tax=Kribbella sp. DT2 TaxID=3393427 RepID=UPI003CE67D63
MSPRPGPGPGPGLDLVRRSGVNAAGMSLGVSLGVSLDGLGLAGDPGTAAAPAVLFARRVRATDG